jgi:hypothetical protein
MKPITKVALAFVVLFLALFGYFIIQGINSVDAAAITYHNSVLPSKIQTACLSYMTEYDRLPPSSDNQKLAAALMGNNSRHIVFVSFSRNELNSKGEIVDRWGTPLQITLQGTSTIQVTSAGPDKIFGTADDIVSNNLDTPAAIPAR